MQTIKETIRQLHGSLRDYIEATYHISAPALIEQRKELLDRPSASFTRFPISNQRRAIRPAKALPPSRASARRAAGLFGARRCRGSSLPALAPRSALQTPIGCHPCTALCDGKNLLIMTGTGSGKTESFLLPILGKLAREASTNPASFRDQPAVRALILYPMNALGERPTGPVALPLRRPAHLSRFSRNGRSVPPALRAIRAALPMRGIRTRDKDSRKLQAFDEFYVEIQRQAQGAPSDEQQQAKTLASASSRPEENGPPSPICSPGSATRARNGRIARPGNSDGR